MTSEAREVGLRQPIWTATYTALCVTVFLAYLNQLALIPVIPLYVSELGGDELTAGVVLGSFSLFSFVLRPWIGRLVDARGAGNMLFVGCALLGAATVGLLIPMIIVITVASIFRGIAWACMNTGANVLLAGLAPPLRRGEASGYFALFPAAAATGGPPLALWWLNRGGSYTWVILGCATAASLAAGIAIALRPVAPGRGPGSAEERREKGSLIARSSVLPSGLLVLVMFTQPAVLGFVPLYAARLGIPGVAVTAFYVVSGLSALLARATLGKMSDRLGRGHAVLTGFTMIAGAHILLQGGTVPLLMMAAALFAAGQGTCQPALMALAIDRADPKHMGVAMATFSAAFQIGQGAGSMVAGALITALGYPTLYGFMAGVAVMGALSCLLRWPSLTERAPG